ncbi:hypothetical protein FLONG3_5995 [Fusarium longipes]|uniref:Uncharacterized protein n=1 Tax=Fusarium longipes TaxID=694270 RepID=A0A395SQZ5_9HYPO|nr:hypothetical protein FLONG3_5995 [Fusarium longipes]
MMNSNVTDVRIGELEVDYDADVWADHEENCHGIDFWADHDDGFGEIDTPEMREEMPDGFSWSCCSKLGGSKGCTKWKHQADPDQSKRGGYVPAGSDMRKNAGLHLPIDDDDNDEDEQDEDEDEEEDE